jgi:predicted MFS family arabinose efflux permease
MKKVANTEPRPHTPAVNAWWATAAGFCASLVGIGLARFAYTPLLPAIIGAHWFEPSKAAYLGAANLAGYLAGALLAQRVAAGTSAAVKLRAMMLLAAVSFFACAYPLSFAWFFAWRFLSGLAGGALMVLAAPTVLPHISPSRRGLAGGIIFMGIGVGIVASGTLVPLLLQRGLWDVWIGLGVVSLLLAAVSWYGWPREALPLAAPVERHKARPMAPLRALYPVYAVYALNAAGWVPHMIFLVDYVARGKGWGLDVGGQYWVLFGIGATVGPLLVGALADRTGFARALRIALVVEIFGVVIPALGLGPVWLAASSVIVGAFVTGTVPLVLGRVHEILLHHPAQQGTAWRKATVAFALCQAVAAYALSFIFDFSGHAYGLLFVIGTAAILVALAIDVAAGTARPASAKA